MRFVTMVTIVALIGTEAIAQEPEQIGAWNISSASDPITDAAIVSALAVGDAGALMVKCVVAAKGKTLSVSFVSKEFLGTSREVGGIVYRVDEMPPVYTTWNVDVGGSRIWVEKPKNTDPLLRGLLGSSKLAVRAGRYDGSSTTAEIPTNGATEALRLPLDRCGRTELK